MCTPSCTDVHKQSVYATHTHWFLSIQSKFKLPLSSFVSMTWSKKTANREIKNFFHLFFLYSYYFCRFFSYIEHTDDVLCAEDTIKTVALRTTGNETRYEIPKKGAKQNAKDQIDDIYGYGLKEEKNVEPSWRWRKIAFTRARAVEKSHTQHKRRNNQNIRTISRTNIRWK